MEDILDTPNETSADVIDGGETASETGKTGKSSLRSHRAAIVTIAVVASVVSAATVGYIFWMRSRSLDPQVQTVQELLDHAHQQIQQIEQRISDLKSA